VASLVSLSTNLAIMTGTAWAGDLSHVFLAQSAALVAFGLINAVAVAGGAWFGRLRWPAKQSSVLRPCIDS
jgi:hypothetical protein